MDAGNGLDLARTANPAVVQQPELISALNAFQDVPQCIAWPRVARRISESDERESCINVSGLLVEQILIAPDQHGYPRASKLTSGKTSVGRFGTQSHGCAGQTVRPSLHSISQTSVGKLLMFDVLSLRVAFDFAVASVR